MHRKSRVIMTCYFLIISAFAVIITVYDKIAAKIFPKSRVPEKVLMGAGFLGGAAAGYITMRIIRHKTRHKKFMVSFPLMAVLHIIIFAIYHFYF